MKITHNKEPCFLAVWALQQYGNHPRVADADDENDDARGYEMYGGVKINTTEDAVFLDLDFDYGS